MRSARLRIRFSRALSVHGLNACATLIACATVLSGAQSEYVGSKVCSGCHKAIYDRYVATAMGRSVTPADRTLQLAPPEGTRVESGGISFEVARRDGQLYESEWQQDAQGNDIFRTTYKLEYGIGSGVNGITYAVRRGDYLLQAPLSYYARAAKWQLSPGYESANQGFNRPIAEGCIACHSGRARPVEGIEGRYADPPFSEMAIGCENCHGPGAAHAKHPAKDTIVNPAHLTLRLSSDICMNCHEAGDVRALRPGKTASDFRPGTALNDTVAILKAPLDPANGAQKDLLEHNFSMMLSKCYRGSSGRLGCLTCHDPHGDATAQSTVSSYNAKCLTCHAQKGCTLKASLRATEPTGCVGCHMPKASVGFVAHSTLTNHRIIREPGEALPAEAYNATSAATPDLIYVNGADSRQLAPIMLLQAYGELADRGPKYRDRYLDVLNQFSASTNDPLVLAALGRKALREGGAEGTQKAIEYLRAAVNGGFKGPATFEDLAAALASAGRTADAIEILKRGIALSPLAPRLQKFLAAQYINAKEYDLARETLRNYVATFPEDNFVRDLLKRVGG